MCIIYDTWFLRYEARQTDFLSFWAIYPTKNPKTQNPEKLKQAPVVSYFTRVYQNLPDMIFCHFG